MSEEKRVVTVTINPAIDQTIVIHDFKAGAVNRVQSSQLNAGGKGINVASFFSDYGQPNLDPNRTRTTKAGPAANAGPGAEGGFQGEIGSRGKGRFRGATVTGFLGSENDEIFRRFFAKKGIEDRCVRIAGQTRIGLKIIDEAQQQTTDINFPGLTPGEAEIAELLRILRELSAECEWFVLSGSIPAGVSPGIYREMVTALAGRKVVLDTSGEGFRQAIAAGPWLVKPNLYELEEFVGSKLDMPENILEVARTLAKQYGIRIVVVSLGKEGAIFVEGDETIWAMPPPIQVKSTVGAGDAMVAGIVAGKIYGFSLDECARLATAFAMDALTRVESGLSSLQAVQAAKEQVTIRVLAR